VTDIDAKVIERRRSRRTRLNLRGRYMLSDGGEHPCETIDVSVTGLAISAYVVADLKERVVAYIDELGRLEGVVARRGNGWFAIDVKIPQSRIDRLAQKIAALTGDAGASTSGAPELQTRSAELRTEFGQTFPVRLCNPTRFSARVVADFQLLPGTRVTVDQRSAVVAHDTADGFILDFVIR
jgi:uncharacterized small protein (DUF1192 family)